MLGAVVGNFCMDLAIKLAKEHGVGWVTAKQSNHFGIAGHYSLRAAAHGLVVRIKIEQHLWSKMLYPQCPLPNETPKLTN